MSSEEELTVDSLADMTYAIVERKKNSPEPHFLRCKGFGNVNIMTLYSGRNLAHNEYIGKKQLARLLEYRKICANAISNSYRSILIVDGLKTRSTVKCDIENYKCCLESIPIKSDIVLYAGKHSGKKTMYTKNVSNIYGISEIKAVLLSKKAFRALWDRLDVNMHKLEIEPLICEISKELKTNIFMLEKRVVF